MNVFLFRLKNALLLLLMIFVMFCFFKVIISVVGILLFLVFCFIYLFTKNKSVFTSFWGDIINNTHQDGTEKSRKTSHNPDKVAKDGKVFDTDFEETDDK